MSGVTSPTWYTPLLRRGWIALVALSGCGSQGTSADIHLDSKTRHQTILGWEAAAQGGQAQADWPSFRDELLDLAVDEVGINRLRLEVRACCEHRRDWYAEDRGGRLPPGLYRQVWYTTENDNDDPHVINPEGFHFSELDEAVEQLALPLAKRLAARGEKLLVNVCYVAFREQAPPRSEYCHRDPEEYAEMALATHLHLRDKYGLVPDAWEIILEPDNSEEWRSGKIIGEALVATRRRLKAEGFAPALVAPSCCSMLKTVEYFDELAQVPGAVEALDELSYHRYRDAKWATVLEVAARAKQHGLKTTMNEQIGAGDRLLHQDLRWGNNSAWQQFALGFPGKDDGSKYLIVRPAGSQPRVALAERTWRLRQYFKHIRAGAVRIEARTSDKRFDPVAFVHPDGRHTLVIRSEHAGPLTVHGLPGGRYGVVYTTDAEQGREGPELTASNGAPLHTHLPAPGVITIYAKSEPNQAGTEPPPAASAGEASA